jgi:hypothetical protein
MNQLERVARAICGADGNDPDEDYSGMVRYWELYRKEAQAAIDAMAEDIAAADRAARLECAEICDDEKPYTYSAYIAADKIREAIK